MARTNGSIVRPVLIALGLAGATTAAVIWWRHRPGPAPVFTTTTVARADLVQNVTATGTLESVTEIDVSSQISGLISEVVVDYNTPVHAGDVLARIDPSTYQQKVKQAEADLASSTAGAQLARLEAQRSRELRARSLVAQQDLDEAEAKLAQAEATLLTKQASLANARVDLERCTITAPIDGIVLDRATEKGKTVAASLNAPTLFTIVNDLTKMRIVASVAEADVGTVEVGQPVSFTVDAFPSRTFLGTISQIRNAPKTVSNVVTYETIVDVDNSDLKLRPGMTANVAIVVASHRGTLVLANSALRVRIPDALLAARRIDPPTPPAGAAPAPKQLTEEELRTARREILREAGFTFGGPPTPEVIAKAKEIAKARGLEIDFSRRPGGSPGREGEAPRATPQSVSAPVTRTVFKLVGTDATDAKIMPLSVKLGITDGINTEVLDSLSEGDVIITAVSTTATGTAATGTNPFAPQRMPGPRR